MSFTAKDVIELREKTGCGMMDCKKALVEAGGDQRRAIDLLREKGLAAAAKKAGRIAAEGLIVAKVKPELKNGAIIEVNSETDFVAKNADFIRFVDDCAEVVIDKAPVNLDELLACKLGDRSVEEVLKEKILVIGENLKIRRFRRLDGVLYSYVHGEGRIGVLVKFCVEETVASSEEFRTMAKNVALQIAAVNPIYLDKESVPAEVIDSEKQIFMARAMNEGKAQNIAEKMVLGRIAKFYKENCLLEQEFIKDASLSLGAYVEGIASQLQTNISIVEFVRFERGEGLVKKEDNFAQEVANMIK